jgi:hemolysin III
MAQVHQRFSISWFIVQAVAQYAALMVVFRFALPKVWAAQFAAGWLPVVLVFLGMHLFMCFFEWAFHRYVLHAMVSRPLNTFASAHRSHHGLTPIKLQPASEGSDRYVLNRYPITEEEQHQDSAFPWWALAAWWLLFTPLLALLQWALPSLPVLFGGYAAITWSMFLYEILHAIEHLPYEWWKRATEHPRFGSVWRQIYGFHHMHHANIGCNEAISGFFGLPVADWAFGTYHQPKELLLEGRVATAKDFAVPPPPALVRRLDEWARKRESQLRRSG